MALFGSKKTKDKAQEKSSTKAKAALAKKTALKEKAVSMQELYADSTKTAKTSASLKKGREENAHKFIIKPLITEKATDLVSQNKYVFVVSEGANKIAVAKAIETIYGIKPLKVNLSNVKGKKVSRGRIRGQRKDWCKAVITLPQGQSIKIYEGV